MLLQNRPWPHLEIRTENIYCSRVRNWIYINCFIFVPFFFYGIYENHWGNIIRTRAYTVHWLFSPADDLTQKKDTWLTCGIGRKEGGPQISILFVSIQNHTRFTFSCVPTHLIHFTKRCLQLHPPTTAARHILFLMATRAPPKGNIIRFITANCKVKLYGTQGASSSLCSMWKNSAYYNAYDRTVSFMSFQGYSCYNCYN